MARTAERVRELVSEDPSMEAVLETVLERADGGELQWSDVSDDLTSGQWGRLIETGVLVGGDEGMRIEDPDAVRRGLYGEAEAEAGAESEDEGEEPDSSWSKWDKLAGLLALSLFPGYYLNSIRNIVGSVVNAFLGPLAAVLPFYVVILILAVVTGLYSTLLQHNLMDTSKMSYYQDKMEDLSERREAAKERGDDEELERIQKEQMEAMGENLGMFKEQFRPMAWTMLLIIPVFLWMYWKILGGHLAGDPTAVLPLVGPVTDWTAGVVGPLQTWIVWYFLCSMSLSQIIRKSLNLQISPTG
ncbi:MAG: DUF106 domain-containing protein [Halobacteriaceae archaeon]